MSQRYWIVLDANDQPVDKDGCRVSMGAFAYECKPDAFTAAKLFTSKSGNSHAVFEIQARMVCQKTIDVQTFQG